MQPMEWTTVDKSTWPEGPWQTEPDKAQWTDEETGLPCLIHRGPSGALCGYVGVSEGHAFYGIQYDACHSEKLQSASDDGWGMHPKAHGGLTFSDRCNPEATPESGICHAVESGEDDNVWWLGFDCAHSGDYCPKYGSRPIFAQSEREVYRDFEYVRHECRRLAEQLSRL